MVSNEAIDRFIDSIVAEGEEVCREDLRKLLEALVRADIDRLEPARLRDFKRDPIRFWRDWTREDIVRRLELRLRLLAADPAFPQNAGYLAPDRYIVQSGIKRALRTFVFGGVGASVALGLVRVIAPEFAPVAAVLVGSLAAGGEKSAREVLRNATGNKGADWLPLLRSVLGGIGGGKMKAINWLVILDLLFTGIVHFLPDFPKQEATLAFTNGATLVLYLIHKYQDYRAARK